jgi:hypothetical protein
MHDRVDRLNLQEWLGSASRAAQALNIEPTEDATR